MISETHCLLQCKVKALGSSSSELPASHLPVVNPETRKRDRKRWSRIFPIGKSQGRGNFARHTQVFRSLKLILQLAHWVEFFGYGTEPFLTLSNLFVAIFKRSVRATHAIPFRPSEATTRRKGLLFSQSPGPHSQQRILLGSQATGGSVTYPVGNSENRRRVDDFGAGYWQCSVTVLDSGHECVEALNHMPLHSGQVYELMCSCKLPIFWRLIIKPVFWFEQCRADRSKVTSSQ